MNNDLFEFWLSVLLMAIFIAIGSLFLAGVFYLLMHKLYEIFDVNYWQASGIIFIIISIGMIRDKLKSI